MAKPEVLFVCVHNAGRSQMAAGLLDHLAAGRIVVRSAGSDPADQVDPTVVEVMRELDIDISKEFPKPLAEGAVRAAIDRRPIKKAVAPPPWLTQISKLGCRSRTSP